MSLKLSYRDKVIFIAVMIILVLVAGFFLLIRPKFESVETAKENLETQKQKRDEIDAKIKTLPDIIQEIKDVAKIVEEKQEIFFSEAEPYENENYVRAIVETADLEVLGMKTEYTVAGPLSWYFNKNEHILAYENKINTDLYNELPQEVYDLYNGVEKTSGHVDAILGVTIMTVSTAPPSSMDDIYAIIDKFAADEKALTVNSVETTVEKQSKSSTPADSSSSSASVDESEKMDITLTLYSIYPLNVEKVMEETDEVKVAE